MKGPAFNIIKSKPWPIRDLPHAKADTRNRPVYECQWPCCKMDSVSTLSYGTRNPWIHLCGMHRDRFHDMSFVQARQMVYEAPRRRIRSVV